MLNEFSQCVHNAQVERGFYDEKREIGTLLMLIVSELAEALEADRKGRHCPNGVAKEIYEESVRLRGCSSAFEGRVKDTFEDEIADTHIERLAFPAFDTGEPGERLPHGHPYVIICSEIEGKHTEMISGGDARKVYPDLVYLRRLAQINGYKWEGEEAGQTWTTS